MTQKDNILQELTELNSTLINISREGIYNVPSGYFDGLAAQVLNRIKAMEELGHLSPLLGKISKQVPYAVPQNYFEGLAEKILALVREKDQTVKEELELISPLLSGLKKQMPFTVPRGYFENLAEGIVAEENKQPVKVISFTRRKWFRYAAAAVVIGFIAVGGFIYQGKKNHIDPAEQPYAWIEHNFKAKDSTKIDAFVRLVDEDLTDQKAVAINPVNTEEIKELMKDVSDKEIQDFLNEVPDTEGSSTDDESIVN